MTSTVPDPAMSDERSYQEAWRRAREEQAFWNDHRAAYRREYPDEFVAVIDGKVVAHDPDYMALVQQLGTLGYALTDAWVQYMMTERRPFLL